MLVVVMKNNQLIVRVEICREGGNPEILEAVV